LTKSEEKTLAGVISLGRRYLFDERHGLQVAKLSLSLFDQLTGLHELSAEDRIMLLAAAMLHDIGMFISCRRHHKHSMYLISEGAITGFSTRQMRIIAQVARYHRKSEPSSRHGSFSRLHQGDRSIVEKLSAILRVADVLDREHQQSVRSVIADIRRNTLRLKIKQRDGKNGIALERSVFKSKTNWFERQFRLRVSLSEGTAV